MLGIIGKKIGMAQIFRDNGDMIPVTYVLCEPNVIHQVKNADEKDNGNGLVLGHGTASKKAKTKHFQTLKQFNGEADAKKGDKVDVGIFEEGEKVTTVATSKGKGFQGGVRRHNFRVARRTHGTKEPRHGSTSNLTVTGRQQKGLKMAGRMGNDQVTLHNREVVKVDAERNLIAIKGPISGPKNGIVVLRKQS